MAKRILRIRISSPNDDILPEELDKICEVLNLMEDWQLTGERIEDVSNFVISATKEVADEQMS